MNTTNNCKTPNSPNQPINSPPATIQGFVSPGFSSIQDNTGLRHEEIRNRILVPVQLENSLQQWINEAEGTEEHSHRVRAATKIRTCYHHRSSNLDLSHLSITSLPALPEHPLLTHINLFYTKITSLHGIQRLQSLTHLNLSNTQITSFNGMPELQALTELYLSNTKISSFHEMPRLPALNSLDLEGTPITSFEGMPELQALTKLHLCDTKITSFEEMPRLPALTELYLSNTPITNFHGMPRLEALTHLDLADAQISSFEGMPKLPALTALLLNQTRITSFNGMPELLALTAIYLQGTPIRSFHGMPRLSALTSLYLQDTQIRSFEGMPEHPSLTDLYLQGTPITSFNGMPRLPALTSLYLGGTQITSLHGVIFSPTLRFLYLARCPIASFAGCSFDSGLVQDIPEQRLIELGAAIRERIEDPENGPSFLSELENLFQSREISSSYQNLLSHSDANQLANFITRMRNSWSSYAPDLRSYLDLANINSEFREVLFLEIQTTQTNCHDRPLYFFGRLSVIASYYQAKQEDLPDNMLRALLAMHSIQLIEQKSLTLSRTEGLEAALLLILRLQSRLGLPTCLRSMGNQEFARMLLSSEPDIEDQLARTCLEAQTTAEQKTEIVKSSPYFQKQFEKDDAIISLENKFHGALELIDDPNHEDTSEEIQRIARNALPEGARIDQLTEQQKKEAQDNLLKNLQRAKQEALTERAEELVRRAEERSNADRVASA